MPALFQSVLNTWNTSSGGIASLNHRLIAVIPSGLAKATKMRWMWVDRFTEFESKKSAKSVKNLSLAEDHFAQHFPGYPVMPVSLMLEGLAQTGGILVGEANNFQEKVVLAKIGNAKFTREAMAGETLIYSTSIVDLRPEGATIEGKVHVNGELIGSAEIMFMHLDKARSGAIFGDKNFVFAGDLGNLLGLSRLKNAQTASN